MNRQQELQNITIEVSNTTSVAMMKLGNVISRGTRSRISRYAALEQDERDEEKESGRAAGPQGGAWRGISQTPIQQPFKHPLALYLVTTME